MSLSCLMFVSVDALVTVFEDDVVRLIDELEGGSAAARRSAALLRSAGESGDPVVDLTAIGVNELDALALAVERIRAHGLFSRELERLLSAIRKPSASLVPLP